MRPEEELPGQADPQGGAPEARPVEVQGAGGERLEEHHPLGAASNTPPDAPAPPRPAPVPPLVDALKGALAKVETATAETDAVEMVHDARKAIKEYRALLRLVGNATADAARRDAASVARSLAHARDRATALEALDLLRQAGMVLECDFKTARAIIGADAVPPQEADELRGALHAFLADARGRLAGGLEAEAAAADLAEGLRRGYKAARSADFHTAAAMHEARKRVVAHRYQMSFLASHFGGQGAKRAGLAQRLRDVFGAYQDIETLRPALHAAAAQLGEGTLERLDIAMTRLQKRLKKQARKRHALLFRRPSAVFARKLRRRLARGPSGMPEAHEGAAEAPSAP